MTIPLPVRFEVLERDGYKCRYCGKRAPETELEVDHIFPRADGGGDEMDNLATTCRDCNRGKGRRHVAPPNTTRTLDGQFFHTFNDKGYINRQGMVRAEVSPGAYLVTYFSWFSGTPGFGEHVVTIRKMEREGWAFYRSAEAMQESYKYSGRRDPRMKDDDS